METSPLLRRVRGEKEKNNFFINLLLRLKKRIDYIWDNGYTCTVDISAKIVRYVTISLCSMTVVTIAFFIFNDIFLSMHGISIFDYIGERL